MTRLHPRCGTSFLFVVVVDFDFAFCARTALFSRPAICLSVCLSRLALLPFVVAISYEFNRLVGRHDNGLTRALSAPGMWFQHLYDQRAGRFHAGGRY